MSIIRRGIKFYGGGEQIGYDLSRSTMEVGDENKQSGNSGLISRFSRFAFVRNGLVRFDGSGGGQIGSGWSWWGP